MNFVMENDQKLNILLVDDRPENLVALESVLSELGQNLVKANSGREALKHVLSRDFAVILLDVQMPDMDGFETATLIRSRDRSRHTPIVFLTAINKSETQVSRGYSVGAVDYVFKPFEPEILKAKVAVFVDLARKTGELEREVERRSEAEEQVRSLNEDLERRVAQRTAELETTNRDLQREILERRRAEEERTRLLEREQAAREEAEEAQQRVAFLGEASAMLATSLDFGTTLERVARLAVPFLSDFSVVDVTSDESSTHRIAVAHRDPQRETALNDVMARQAAAEEFGASHEPGTENGTGAPTTGSHDTPWLIGPVPRPVHLEAVRAADPKSYLVVPLVARGRTIGLLGFGMAASGRSFRHADMTLAEDLARRAAAAIDNTLLFREIQTAATRKDEFMAMLAHELRNPLAAIANASSLLSAIEARDVRGQKVRETISRQTQHLARLVDDLLDVSRISRGKVELRWENVDVAQVIQRALETTRSFMESRNHTVSLKVPDEQIWLNADSTRLEQVLSNLLNNAAKYTEPGGRIWVDVEREGAEVAIRVRDSGAGIPKDLLPHVFELFTQADRSLDRSQGGLGIGLALVQSLVRLHGGTVEAHSAGPGKGSQFTVRLPAMKDSETPARGEAGAPESLTSGEECPALPHTHTTGTSGLRVLLVDDNVDAAEALLGILEMWGCDVAVAHDGPSALAAAEAGCADVCLIDIGLPGMDGYEVARRLRHMDRTAGAVLIALTGYGQEEDRRRSREAGFHHHLVKPVDLSTLQDLLESARQIADGCDPDEADEEDLDREPIGTIAEV